MKIRSLFEKYQRHILAFANTTVGRSYLGITDKDRIVLITPDSWHTIKERREKEDVIQARFYSRSPFIKKLALALQSIALAEEFYNFIFKTDEFIIPHFLGLCAPRSYLPQILYTTTAFNPNANPETTSVDGTIFRNGINETWAQIRGAATGTNVDDSSANGNATSIVDSGSANQWQTLNRGVFLFDTSSLTSSAVVSAASFQVYVSSKTDHHSQTVQLVTSNPASNIALSTADYNITNFGTSSLLATGIAVASLSTSAYNTWTLNSTGIAALSKTSITKLGLLFSGDASNSEPTYIGSGNGDTVSIDYADGTNKPILTITYQTGAYFATIVLET